MGRQFAQLNDMVKVSLMDMMGSEQRLKEVRKREEYSRQKGPPEQRPSGKSLLGSFRDSKEAIVAGVEYRRG